MHPSPLPSHMAFGSWVATGQRCSESLPPRVAVAGSLHSAHSARPASLWTVAPVAPSSHMSMVAAHRKDQTLGDPKHTAASRGRDCTDSRQNTCLEMAVCL